MKNSENAETINRKLDCLLLTARVSKSTTRDLQKLSKPKIENDLSKEILAKILQIKRTEERVVHRLDYWIYGEMVQDFERSRSKTGPLENEGFHEQTWDLNIHSRASYHNDNKHDAKSDKLMAVGRSVSSVDTQVKRKKTKPWKSGTEKAESISMFHYNMKSGKDEDAISTTATLRTRIFSKFGTLPRKKLKMFFTRGNDDERKSTKGEKIGKDIDKPKENIDSKGPSIFAKYRRRNSKKEINSTNDNDKDVAPRVLRRKSRPKSEAFDFNNLDTNNIATITIDNLATTKNGTSSARKGEASPLKEKLYNMPIFYAPPKQKMI